MTQECESRQRSTSGASNQQSSPEADDRSDNGFPNVERIPGAELHPAVYRSIAAAFIAALLATWIGFGYTERSDLDLTIAALLTTMFFAVPAVMVAAVRARSRWRRSLGQCICLSRTGLRPSRNDLRAQY